MTLLLRRKAVERERERERDIHLDEWRNIIFLAV